MLPLSLLLGALSSAPFLGQYLFDPSDVRIPEWTDPLVDSLRSDRPTGFQAVVYDTTGKVIGRDTLKLFLDGATIHSIKTQWHYGTDTTRSVMEVWRKGVDGPIDSLLDLGCTPDTCSTEFSQWAVTLQDGQLYVLAYPPSAGSTTPRHDSILTRTDAQGRLVYSHVRHSTNTGYTIDSIRWDDVAPTRWRRDWRNAGTLSIETHHPTWDGIRLVRDSVTLRTTPDGGTTTDSTYVRTCSWDGTRFLKCVALHGSSTLSLMEWTASGKPSFQFNGRRASAWGWDAQGRLTRERRWGAETDLDSLVYGSGVLPERSLIFDCTGEMYMEPDTCSLRKTRVFGYDIANPAGVLRASRPRPSIRRTANGLLRFDALDPRTASVALASSSGRILSSTAMLGGSAMVATERMSGLAIWITRDSRGRTLASGTVPLP